MKFEVSIEIMPKKELLDPQGKAVVNNLKYLHLEGVEDVRIGKHVWMQLEAADEKTAREKVTIACQQLLANPIMESYQYQIKQV